MYPAITETFSKPVSKPKILTEVPTISYLIKQVESYMKSSNQSLKINKTLPWNTLFHKILDDYDLKGSFTPQTLPGSYTKGQNCGYISLVDLADSTTKFLYYLTTLENAKNPDLSVPNEILCKFIYSVTFCNPVWDIGLQHKLASKNLNRDYNLQLQHIQNYNTNCVCPCSKKFAPWHESELLHNLPRFAHYDSSDFKKQVNLLNICVQNRNVTIIESFYGWFRALILASYHTLKFYKTMIIVGYPPVHYTKEK